MAMLLAPYHNAMRLGQGFNSYTQQICLDQAVLPNTTANRKLLAARVAPKPIPSSRPDDANEEPPNEDTADQVESYSRFGYADPEAPGPGSPLETAYPWIKPQIVTYSSRFVDKLSDVTDSMNISGSLSIKTATIGGKANGSYIDSDKFKSSDINFHLQVRVTNQIHDATDYNIFNKIPIAPTQFAEVYGDTFISGWEEGGELNAIISVKVLDKAKVFSIKAGLEAELTTPGIAGKVEAKADIEKSTLNKETETTISVNWSGGGSIKDPDLDWSIGTLKAAAAGFPEMVATTPQRTHAILTKYTALESFHRQLKNFSPLDYENAGIYTGSLLDAYMDYKVLWKQISNATYELEGNRATIDMGQPSEETAELAKVKDLPVPVVVKTEAEQARERQIKSSPGSSQYDMAETDTQVVVAKATLTHPRLDFSVDAKEHEFPVFSPSFAGLIKARKVCRSEMSKIVREVDYVAKDPSLALDPSRDQYFLPPLVFKQLLPIIRSLSAENRLLGVRDPAAPLLLGYSAPQNEDRFLPLVYKLSDDLTAHSLRIRKTLEKVAHRARDYTIQGFAGIISEEQLHSQAEVVNHLEEVDATYRPIKITIWSDLDRVQGIELGYANGKKQRVGPCNGTMQELALAFDGSEVIVEVRVHEVLTQQGVPELRSVEFATSSMQTISSVIPPGTTSGTSEDNAGITSSTEQGLKSRYKSWIRPDDTRYSIRGFLAASNGGKICTLGVVWGKDSFVPVPAVPIRTALCKNFLGLSPGLQNNLRGHAKFAGKFLTGTYIDTTLTEEIKTTDAVDTTFFSAMDKIDVLWRINSLSFAAVDGKLTGLKVKYHNGIEVTHGGYSESTHKWQCDVRSSLAIIKMTGGSVGANDSGFVDTMEFVRANNDGELADWPMDLSTLRFLPSVDNRVLFNPLEVIDKAPKVGHEKLSIRGFFGECKGGIISKLGAIWGGS